MFHNVFNTKNDLWRMDIDPRAFQVFANDVYMMQKMESVSRNFSSAKFPRKQPFLSSFKSERV